jgi:hypothetical protein
MIFAAGNQPAVTLGPVSVYPIGRRHLDKPVGVAALDPVLFSEIVRDLSALRG